MEQDKGRESQRVPNEPIHLDSSESPKVELARAIVFLDIDGVLATHDEYAAGTLRDQLPDFKKEAVDQLREILAAPESKIVISSTWKIFGGQAIRTRLESAGLLDRLHDDWKTGSNIVGRGAEIHDWLAEHPEVTRYTVLDDNTCGLTSEPNLVKIDPKVGLRPENTAAALKMLEPECA